jgi:nucleoid DNA-binding protein
MTQDEFLDLIAKKADVTRVDIDLVMGAFVEVFQECVIGRKPFIIQNIGALEFSKVKARNSSKLLGSKMLPETETFYFHLSKNLKALFKNTKKQEDTI